MIALTWLLVLTATVNTHAEQTSSVDMSPSPGLYGIDIAVEGHPPAVPVQLAIAKLDDNTHKMVDSAPPFASGAIGQATGSIDSSKKILYMLDGLYDGKSLSYRIAARNLGDGTLLGIYPLPEIPMVQWTGFGQQLGVDTSLDLAVVFAPSNASQYSPPFDYGLWAVDLAKNRTKLLMNMPNPPGTTPIFEGFPADVCSKTHTFYVITGVGATRYLVAIDLVAGKIRFEKELDVPPSLTLIAVDSSTGRLWGAGYSDHAGGTMTLLELDTATGAILSNTPATALGTGWNLNALPGIVAIDSAKGALVFPATSDSKSAVGNPQVSLVRLPFPVTKVMPTATSGFCTLSTTHTNFTCPKLLHYYDAPLLQ
jgi:hypothetical protein